MIGRQTAYSGNSYIGMFAETNNEITLVPLDANEKFRSVIEENLKTKTIPVGVANSNLIGIYIVMNSNGIILPNVVEEEEIRKIKETGLNIYVSKDLHNANGNNIVANDKGGIISIRISDHERRNIADALGVELYPTKIAEHVTVGSSCIANNKGFLSHFRTTEAELQVIEEVLKVKGNVGTINMGTGFVSLGVLANDHSYVIGMETTAFEAGRIEEALGFLE